MSLKGEESRTELLETGHFHLFSGKASDRWWSWGFLHKKRQYYDEIVYIWIRSDPNMIYNTVLFSTVIHN